MDVEISKDGTVKLNFPSRNAMGDSGEPSGEPVDEYSAVIIPLGGKKTLCLSSQVGCSMGCAFCLSGKRSFERNLSLDELKGQLDAARKYLDIGEEEVLADKINGIVFMGMGEPLLNLDSVLAFCDFVNSEYGYAYSRILVSTSGIVPGMERVMREYPNKIQLAVSLHSPFQDIRDKIMPGLKGYPLKDLVEVMKRYNEVYRQKIMIEYVMIEGVNDRDEDLAVLLGMGFVKRTNFNLIPLNASFELCGKMMKSSSLERMAEFRDALMGAGYKCFTRTSMGEDIDAACGMLR